MWSGCTWLQEVTAKQGCFLAQVCTNNVQMISLPKKEACSSLLPFFLYLLQNVNNTKKGFPREPTE